MAVGASRLAELLAGTMLEGRPVAQIPVPGVDHDALSIACSPSEVLAAWTAARSVLDDAARWPVVAAAWGGDVDEQLFNRFPFDHGAGDDVSILGIVQRAAALDVSEVFARLAERDAEWDGYEQLPFELPSTERLVGRAPTEQEVRSALGPSSDHATLDRFLLDWEERAGGGAPPTATHLDWFEPTGLEVAVVFLPTANGWETPAYMSFFGAEGPGGAEGLIAVLRSWHERYGAEVAAHYGTMLELVVRRPPSTLDDAWTLAREQELVAQCTTILPGVTLRDHARCLVDRGTWFLHERP